MLIRFGHINIKHINLSTNYSSFLNDMHIGHRLVVEAGIEFLLDLAEHLNGAVGVFHRVDSRRDDAQHNLTLRHNGINHN